MKSMSPNTACHLEASVCWNSRWRLLITFAMLLAGETRAYWTLMPHKEPGRLFSFLHLPPLPSPHPPKRGKVRTACQSRKKGRFDSNKNRLSNHLVLSSPDSGEEGCVRKSREPRMSVMASSLGFAISPTSDLARPPLVRRNLLPRGDYVSVRNTSPWVASNTGSGVKEMAQLEKAPAF